MTIARQYVMIAREGEGKALHTALIALAHSIRAIEGAEDIELLRDIEQPEHFIFIERWSSIEAHRAGGKQLPKGLFAPVMAALRKSPDARDLEYLPLL